MTSSLIQSLIHPLINALTPLSLSVLFGTLIGLEREFVRKPAGVRTCALVCLSSCLLCLVAQALPPIYADRGHIAANIVQGIGFLCAGSILIHKNKVVGLTTAAVVWCASGIGMAVGFHLYLLASLAVFICLTVLTIFRIIESKLLKYKYHH